MKTILITNDDGYISRGLTLLRESLQKIARVVVVAPANEKSACGHGLCVSKPLQLIEIEKDFYKLDDGTPTDCIYLALCELFKEKKPDLVISGINIGSNMGEDITYSGTVAGAMEGAIHGIPSIAISQYINDKHGEDDKEANRDFGLATHFIASFANEILSGNYEIGYRKFININVPAISLNECRGVKITQLGKRIYSPSIEKFINPRQQTFYWIGMNSFNWENRDNTNNPYIDKDNSCKNFQRLDSKILKESSKKDNKIKFVETKSIESDFNALDSGYIAITPIHLDNTSYEDFKALSSALKNI